ncbi:tumor necrosis factor receptor superfamily member 4-like [Eleutherodactylus coqui]|uniref:tumor necrosis factor receptor superfamily member 4-like n=1 Tax=Eleutherodactylus coqui TaxID=57060 RepID=UPI0034625BDE
MAAVCLQAVTGLLLLSVLLPPSAAACAPDEYYEKLGKEYVCCKYCAAGEQISEVCTSRNKASKCVTCKKNYYNPKTDRGPCKQCDVCSRAQGSLLKQPCTDSSNTICECPEGSRPLNNRNTACQCDAGKEIVENKCLPCKTGYFSTQKNSACRPWKDCNATGQGISEHGSATKDVKCSKLSPGTVGITTTSVTPASSAHRRNVTSLQNVTTTTNQIAVNIPPTPGHSFYWGTLSLILIGTILLLLSAGIILTMITQIKNKKVNRGFKRGERFRVPVQEESTGSDSSIAKDCPA